MAKKQAAKKVRSPKSSNKDAWEPFLQRVSRDQLRDLQIREELPSDVVTAKWLGYAGATEAEIVQLETKLRTRLPPSYRDFLKASNGWRSWGAFIHRIWPCAKVAWFKQRNKSWIEAYNQEEDEVGDADYFVYGAKQDSVQFRASYLKTALEVSAAGDSAILLLNPQVVDKHGEWEAWFFANWLPGARRYRSFRELMIATHRDYVRILKDAPPQKSKYGTPGQQAARHGETEKAIALLREPAQTDPESANSLAELFAFRGDWHGVIECFACLLKNLAEVVDFSGQHRDLLHLLGRAGHETQNWKRIAQLVRDAIKHEKQRQYDQYHEYNRERMLHIYKNLAAYCRRRGAPPHELMNLFGDERGPLGTMSLAERQQWYDKALANNKSNAKQTPRSAAHGRFTLAEIAQLDEILIREFEAAPKWFWFKEVLAVARAYMRQDNPNAAWRVLETRLQDSVVGAPEHVAPIVLLVDETLRPLLTAERCLQVLRTPRGLRRK